MSNYKQFHDRAINKLKGLPVDKSTFCPLPFVHVSTMPHGEVKLCCRAQPPQNDRNPYVTDPDFNFNNPNTSNYDT